LWVIVLAILGYIVYDMFFRESFAQKPPKQKEVQFNPMVELNTYDPNDPVVIDYSPDDLNTIDGTFDMEEEVPRGKHIYIQLKHGEDKYTLYVDIYGNEELGEMFLAAMANNLFLEAHSLEVERGRWVKLGHKHGKGALFGNSKSKERKSNARGTLSVIPNSSEFVINLKDNKELDGVAFPIGSVSGGLEFVDIVGRGQTNGRLPLVVTYIGNIGFL